MSKESEEQVQEPRAPYTATAETAVEERDRRLGSELERLEAAIEHNSTGITHSLMEMDRRFAEAKEEREALRAEMDRRFTEAKEEREALRAEMDRRFAEAKEERKLLRTEMHSQFRWTIGLLFPLVAGMLAIIIRVFFAGTF